MTSLLDRHRLHDITEGDAQLERQLYVLFIETCERCLLALDAQVDDGSGGWPKTVHELKGACMNMYVQSMVLLCREMEHMQPAAERREKLDVLTGVYEQVRAEIAAFIPSPQ